MIIVRVRIMRIRVRISRVRVGVTGRMSGRRRRSCSQREIRRSGAIIRRGADFAIDTDVVGVRRRRGGGRGVAIEERRRFDVARFVGEFVSVRMKAVGKRRYRTVGRRSVGIVFDIIFVLNFD